MRETGAMYLLTFLEKKESSNGSDVHHSFFAGDGGFEPGHDWMDGCSFLCVHSLRGEAR